MLLVAPVVASLALLLADVVDASAGEVIDDVVVVVIGAVCVGVATLLFSDPVVRTGTAVPFGLTTTLPPAVGTTEVALVVTVGVTCVPLDAGVCGATEVAANMPGVV